MKQNFNVKLEFKRNETEKLGKNFGWIISAIRLSNLVLLSVSEKANGVYHFCVFFFGTHVWLLLYAPLIIHITQLDCGVCVCVCCSCLLCLHLMYNIPNSLQSEFTFDIISFDIPSKVLYSPSIYLYLYFHSVRQPGYVQNNTRSIPCTKLDTHFHPHFVVFVREWEKEISITKQQKYIFNFRSRDVIFLSFGFFVPFRFVSFCMFFFSLRLSLFLCVFFPLHVCCRLCRWLFWPFDWPLLLFLFFFDNFSLTYTAITRSHVLLFRAWNVCVWVRTI